ncbi:hypothetical protein K2173_015601 [Erythroxylum novogranatense]|uniref:DUF3511 domain protein n=1 Tax=Erythroxylum novogranatense TaxID=1862640 RepID=A0AAV8SDZ9_9ROSI|nr:hypothetical protein K2173_015601 [Erythroxylum novogranatense]
MEDSNRSRPCSYKSYGYASGDMMHMESYNGPPKPLPYSYELRSYSASYSQVQVTNTNRGNSNNRNLKLKKGKSTSGSAYAKSWSFADPDFQRKKRVASYKMYSVEAKVKGTFRKSFRWLKDRYTQVVYGW